MSSPRSYWRTRCSPTPSWSTDFLAGVLALRTAIPRRRRRAQQETDQAPRQYSSLVSLPLSHPPFYGFLVLAVVYALLSGCVKDKILNGGAAPPNPQREARRCPRSPASTRRLARQGSQRRTSVTTLQHTNTFCIPSLRLRSHGFPCGTAACQPWRTPALSARMRSANCIPE